MWRTPVLLACLAALGVGCTSAPDRSEGHYCTEVGDHLAQLNSPVITNAADITATLQAWRTVSDAAPLQIQVEWDTVIGALATAATLDPKDPTSLQKVADGARAAEPAANKVIAYTFQKCRATIGPVTPVTGTTTVPPASSVSPTSTAPATAAPSTTG